MPDFVVPPTNTLGVVMRDGTKYLPSKSGTITVSKKHAQEIKNSTAKNKLDMIKEKSWIMPNSDDQRRCTKCYFAPHTFSTFCPRCDEPLPPLNQETE